MTISRTDPVMTPLRRVLPLTLAERHGEDDGPDRPVGAQAIGAYPVYAAGNPLGVGRSSIEHGRDNMNTLRKRRNRMLLGYAVSLLLTLQAQGVPKLYDQVNDPPGVEPHYPSYVPVVTTNMPLGQFFVPLAEQLDSVELRFKDMNRSAPEGESEIVTVYLHEGGSLDPVIASTLPVVVDRLGFGGKLELAFRFEETVPLSPRSTYFLEVVHLDGEAFLGINYYLDNPYPSGGMLIAGLDWSGNDLWFKTGYIIPEPNTAALLIIGSALILPGRRRRRKQGNS